MRVCGNGLCVWNGEGSEKVKVTFDLSGICKKLSDETVWTLMKELISILVHLAGLFACSVEITYYVEQMKDDVGKLL